MLTDRFLARLDAQRLVMRGRAQGGAGGSRRSRQTGSSAEFSDYREYIPGDDIRRLDWNALARFDRLYMKLFMEEQESQVMILLDASASMEDKWSAARSAAETVGYLALTGGDRLRLQLLKDGRAVFCGDTAVKILDPLKGTADGSFEFGEGIYGKLDFAALLDDEHDHGRVYRGRAEGSAGLPALYAAGDRGDPGAFRR